MDASYTIFSIFQQQLKDVHIQGGPKKRATLKRDHFKTIRPF